MIREETIGDCRLILGDCLNPDIWDAGEGASGLILDPPFELWGAFPMFSARSIIAFCSPQSRARVDKTLGKPRTELVWHFADGRWVSNNLPRITHDYIYVYGDVGAADCGEANRAAPQKKGKSSIGKDCLGDRFYIPKPRKQLNSVLSFPRNMNGPLGAWGKPYGLMSQLIEWVGADTYFDPFMGSGTAGVACLKQGRKYIGVEINPEHFEIAVNAIRAAHSEPDLFVRTA